MEIQLAGQCFKAVLINSRYLPTPIWTLWQIDQHLQSKYITHTLLQIVYIKKSFVYVKLNLRRVWTIYLRYFCRILSNLNRFVLLIVWANSWPSRLKHRHWASVVQIVPSSNPDSNRFFLSLILFLSPHHKFIWFTGSGRIRVARIPILNELIF